MWQNIFKLLQQAWSIVYKNKSLWLLGLLASITSSANPVLNANSGTYLSKSHYEGNLPRLETTYTNLGWVLPVPTKARVQDHAFSFEVVNEQGGERGFKYTYHFLPLATQIEKHEFGYSLRHERVRIFSLVPLSSEMEQQFREQLFPDLTSNLVTIGLLLLFSLLVLGIYGVLIRAELIQSTHDLVAPQMKSLKPVRITPWLIMRIVWAKLVIFSPLIVALSMWALGEIDFYFENITVRLIMLGLGAYGAYALFVDAFTFRVITLSSDRSVWSAIKFGHQLFNKKIVVSATVGLVLFSGMFILNQVIRLFAQSFDFIWTTPLFQRALTEFFHPLTFARLPFSVDVIAALFVLLLLLLLFAAIRFLFVTFQSVVFTQIFIAYWQEKYEKSKVG